MAVRTEAEIIEELQGIECGLSPENLTCDGEATRAQVRARSAHLHRQRRILVAELGREPTQQELFPGLFGGTVDRRPVNHSSQGSTMNALLSPPTRTVTNHQVGDLVRLSNGHELIITRLNPAYPANKYLGVKVKGQGTEYKFGDKHRPVFVRKVESNHPALLALQVKKGVTPVVTPPVGFDLKAAVVKLLEAIDESVASASIIESDGSVAMLAQRVKNLL